MHVVQDIQDLFIKTNWIRRTAGDKVLRDNAFAIAKNPKYDGYQRGLAPMVYKFFDKRTSDSGIKIFQKNHYLKNYRNQLLEKLIKEKNTHLL